MSLKAIHQPLPGERIVGLSLENATEAASTWLRRPNLFAGRALTAVALQTRQNWQAGHIATRGQDWVAGVVDGLAVSVAGVALGSAMLSVERGRGLAVSGEDVVLATPLRCRLADVRVVAPAGFFADGSGVGVADTIDAPLRSRVIDASLGALSPASLANLPSVGVLLLRPVQVDVSNLDPFDPCDHSSEAEGTVGDNAAFEDWRMGDAVELVWYVWPQEWRALPIGLAAEPLRNSLAWQIFDAEATLSNDACLPWEDWGVPIALVHLREGALAWLDRASVVRQGGRAREASLQLLRGPAASLGLSANSRLPTLWQAQMEQFGEQITLASEAGRRVGGIGGDFSLPVRGEDLRAAFHRFLPPVGLLPSFCFDPVRQKSDFFPAHFELDAVPVPLEQLDIAVRQSAGLAPLDLLENENVRLMVPVPMAAWEPRLLWREVVDAEFERTLNRYLAVRARMLGVRQGLRVKQSILQGAISGGEPAVVAWNDDAAALEAETLSPWGPPPEGGGHRSALRSGTHQHYFLHATETLTVAAPQLFCWVYLDPEQAPRTLMLQWFSNGSWEHRAFWGEDLIPWGVSGTASRTRIGDLPALGGWVKLSVPVASVGFANGSVIDGMAFTLFDGQAAFAMTGQSNGSKWFCNVLPAGAQTFGDEAWDMLSANDLWAPFEARFDVQPINPPLPPTSPGGHFDAPASGLHEHSVQGMSARGLAAADSLFCWVYLDPVNPPRQVMLELRLADGRRQRAYWGWSLIPPAGGVSVVRAGDLPLAGAWTRLQVPMSVVAPTPPTGAAQNCVGVGFLQFDGAVAFGAIGTLSPSTNNESVWFAERPASGALSASWQTLNERDIQAPTSASQSGATQALQALAAHPALAVLSAQERAQLYVLGVAGFVDYLKSRTDRADDLVDYNFVKVQTDIYRIRQHMLGSTAASRLAVSPALASIAQAETAVATQTQIASFIADLKRSPTALPQGGLPTPSAPRQAARSMALQAPAAAVSEAPSLAGAALGLGGGNFNFGSTNRLISADFQAPPSLRFPIDDGGIDPVPIFTLPKVKVPPTIDPSDIAPIKTPPVLAPAPKDVIGASPVTGSTFIRTTAIAKRLEEPKSKEARDYANASRYEAIQAILRLADALTAEDGGTTPGLFTGVDLHGLEGDEFLKPLAAASEPGVFKKRPITHFFNPRIRDQLLANILIAPVRQLPGAGESVSEKDPDEGAYFSDSANLSDHVIAMMRQFEGRIKRYREAIAVAEASLETLRANVGAITARLAKIGDSLAESRHDVSVARALLAEETLRIEGINTRRAKVLAEEVKFLLYVRPRETDNLLATPMHAIDPGLIDPPVPACLREHPDLADDLLDMLRVVREAPANWFVRMPVLLKRLDRIEHLGRCLQVAQTRALSGLALPLFSLNAGGNQRIGAALQQLAQRQREAVTPRIGVLQNFNFAAVNHFSWQSLQTQAVQMLSFADLADGSHGNSALAQSAAAELQNIRSIVACLHAEFSGIPPVLRLEWAETLSEFDAAPNLRNLASLPRWGELPYIDRRQMQAYVDWLFAQIEPNQPAAVALMNDVVRMCLLLASHAPVDRIIAGRMARPISGVAVGVRIPLAVQEMHRLSIGMHALLYRGETLIARATVEDIGQEISAHVIHTTTPRLDLGDDVRVHFDHAASLSLGAGVRRSLFALK